MKLYQFPANELKLFLAKTADGKWLLEESEAAQKLAGGESVSEVLKMIAENKMLPSWKIEDTLDKFKMTGELAPSFNQVHVLVVAPVETESRPTKRQKLSLQTAHYLPKNHWSDAEQRSRLQVQDGDQLISMPASCVKGTGVKTDRSSLVLFRRKELIDEWKTINHNSIQASSILWICGPSGAGKSCTALAFACSLDPSVWDVLWIHYARTDFEFNCVRMQGDTKELCSFRAYDVDECLSQVLESTSTERKTIVFLDGYVARDEQVRDAFAICGMWCEGNLDKRRLVIVTSMPVIGDDYQINEHREIPNTTELQDNSVQLREQSVFDLFSWTFEDYQRAIENDEFFRAVEDKLPPYRANPKIAESEAMQRTKRLEEKFFVAGGSARVMFDVDHCDATGYVQHAVAAVKDLRACSKVLAGRASSSVLNRLLAIYNNGFYEEPQFKKWLVSDFATRALAIKLGPGLLENMVLLNRFDRSVDGTLFESLFFALLTTDGIRWRHQAEAQRQMWEQSTVAYFDPSRLSTGIYHSKGWLAPLTWNQSGYDAVFIDTDNKLVRFVQVTRALERSFNHIYFVEVLNQLAAMKTPTQFDVVEMCFVVPECNLGKFRSPTDEVDFKTNVLSVAGAPERANSSEPSLPFDKCEAKILFIGVDYKLANSR
ncbi:hypothetical protein PF008_g21583 [Phytophthora fragariae]|uniref:Uncharacterized protein n=1 Tax=Phytophthora fragariae TaxID=53985 RepID=A0A6G0QX66_9STRA|nr:hypothetical protein PF008_g21583 [Phytophthora fragariae]